MTKENTKENESVLLQAFEEVFNTIKAGYNYKRKAIDYDSELIGYALKIYKDFGNITPLKRLLVGTNLFLTKYKNYLEDIGLFFTYKASEDFLKIIKDSEGLFITGVYPTYKEYKESLPKKEVVIDYQKRLTSLFKKANKKDIKTILEAFYSTLK